MAAIAAGWIFTNREGRGCEFSPFLVAFQGCRLQARQKPMRFLASALSIKVAANEIAVAEVRAAKPQAIWPKRSKGGNRALTDPQGKRAERAQSSPAPAPYCRAKLFAMAEVGYAPRGPILPGWYRYLQMASHLLPRSLLGSHPQG